MAPVWRSFADGVRNSVGFDWHPVTRELWFTDNGRDMMGDDVPNDELNVPQSGPPLRFPLLPSGGRHRPGVRRQARVFDDRASRSEARCARRGDRFHLLHRQDVSGQRYQNAAIMAQQADRGGRWASPTAIAIMAARPGFGRQVTGCSKPGRARFSTWRPARQPSENNGVGWPKRRRPQRWTGASRSQTKGSPAGRTR